MIVVFLLNDPNPTARTFVLFVLLLIAAMTAMTNATIPATVYAGLAPVIAAIVIFLAPWDGFQNLSLFIMAIGAQIYFIILARRLYATSINTLFLSMEKEALIGELEQSSRYARLQARRHPVPIRVEGVFVEAEARLRDRLRREINPEVANANAGAAAIDRPIAKQRQLQPATPLAISQRQCFLVVRCERTASHPVSAVDLHPKRCQRLLDHRLEAVVVVVALQCVGGRLEFQVELAARFERGRRRKVLFAAGRLEQRKSPLDRAEHVLWLQRPRSVCERRSHHGQHRHDGERPDSRKPRLDGCAGSCCHIHAHEEALVMQLMGTKVFTLYPPADVRNLYFEPVTRDYEPAVHDYEHTGTTNNFHIQTR